MSKEKSIVIYEDTKTKTTRYEVNGVDITSSVEILKEQFLNQWNNEHKLTTELSFYERNKYAKQITDLEAKLAESEKEKKHYEIRNDKLGTDLCNAENICSYLQQQLAEKETDLSLARNEIDTLKHNLNIAQEHDNVMCEQYFNKCKEAYQDKISFAVEQLGKVKASIEVRLVIIQENYTDDLYTEKEYLDMTVENENILKKIDNQIKQLKEGK